MGHRNRKAHIKPTSAPKAPEAPDTKGRQTPPEQPPAPPAQPTPDKIVSVELRKVLETVPQDSPAYKVIADQLTKLEAEEKASENAKKRLAFDTDFKAGLITLLAGENGLIQKHGIDLSNRRVIISFPNGNAEEPFTYNNADINAVKKSRSGNGFKGDWLKDGKKVQYQVGETVTEYDSPSALAKHLGLRITGHKDMPQVFTKPISAVTNTEITETKYSVDAVRGDHFIVKKIA